MKVAVIADDLTGANATGVLLVKKGLQTTTLLHTKPYEKLPVHVDAVSVNTNSRYVEYRESFQRVSDAVIELKKQGIQYFCKRIDSTVRGNIGVELDAILETLGQQSIAVVVPSFPDSKRMMVGGYLIVNDRLVEETDTAYDLLSFQNDSFVPRIIAKQSKQIVSHIEMDVILQGVESLSKQMQSEIDKGSRIIVIDAMANEHIDAIALAMTKIDKVFVPADPGPLTAGYTDRLMKSSSKPPKILVSVGSITSITGRQLNYLAKYFKTDFVTVNTKELAHASPRRESEIDRCIHQATKRLSTHDVIVLTTYEHDKETVNLTYFAQREGVKEQEIAQRISEGLAAISYAVFVRSEGRIKGLFSSGGDVTAAFCNVVQAHGIELYTEVKPLIAYGYISGGKVDRLPIITKGGMVGNDDAIKASIDFLYSKLY